MTEAVKKALAILRSTEYRKARVNNAPFDLTEAIKDVPKAERNLFLLKEMLKAETPYLLDEDVFGFNRRNVATPHYYGPDGKRRRGCGGANLTPNYMRIVNLGVAGMREELARYDAKFDDPLKHDFYRILSEYLDLIEETAARYKEAARAAGSLRLAEALERIPAHPATTFYEGCVFLKLLTYVLRCTSAIHMTFGRFDQYMYPLYAADLSRGVSREELLEVLELFFISLNVDGDIYIGVQQGDNGQSMVLGGYDGDGNDCYNGLSELCMDASLELSLIDPKINLRVSKKTPDSRYEYGTKLTKQGLGFPQYCNDDVVVPYLVSLGYDEADAWNYTVAACWEHIIPNCGTDVPNRATMNFPLVVDRAVRRVLPTAKDFDEVLSAAKEELALECEALRKKHYAAPKPENEAVTITILSLLVDGCIEKGLDLSQGAAKYNNSGSHGAGIANAADALAAIRTVIFEEKSVTPETLLAALDADFEGYGALQNKLLSCPKMGNNDDSVDLLASELMDAFCKNLNGKPNGGYRGGIWRAGTGSAMEYILTAKKCPATADGRNAGAPYSSSFSPSITTKLSGPLSVIQSFTKFDLTRIANGGPLTMEVHDTVFRNEEGERKVAQLVKAFVHLGGHQLQLNSINRERLLDAKAHPENYPNLIVRVWGWSGYFCELDPEYQDHIIARTEFSV